VVVEDESTFLGDGYMAFEDGDISGAEEDDDDDDERMSSPHDISIQDNMADSEDEDQLNEVDYRVKYEADDGDDRDEPTFDKIKCVNPEPLSRGRPIVEEVFVFGKSSGGSTPQAQPSDNDDIEVIERPAPSSLYYPQTSSASPRGSPMFDQHTVDSLDTYNDLGNHTFDSEEDVEQGDNDAVQNIDNQDEQEGDEEDDEDVEEDDDYPDDTSIQGDEEDDEDVEEDDDYPDDTSIQGNEDNEDVEEDDDYPDDTSIQGDEEDDEDVEEDDDYPDDTSIQGDEEDEANYCDNEPSENIHTSHNNMEEQLLYWITAFSFKNNLPHESVQNLIDMFQYILPKDVFFCIAQFF